jgi:hypothetical protein
MLSMTFSDTVSDCGVWARDVPSRGRTHVAERSQKIAAFVSKVRLADVAG